MSLSEMYKYLPDYSNALDLLQKNPSSLGCVRMAQISGWNFALETNPQLAVGIWNHVLPPKLRINIDAFEDKGHTPDWMTRSEMEEVHKIRGETDDPHDPKFKPFKDWHLPNPRQSPLAIKHAHIQQEQKRLQFQKTQKMKNVHMESDIK